MTTVSGENNQAGIDLGRRPKVMPSRGKKKGKGGKAKATPNLTVHWANGDGDGRLSTVAC